MNTAIKEFPLRNHTMHLKVSEEELFMPNAVTRLFSRAVAINSGDIVFDIGSGIGPLAIWAAKEPSEYVHAVEIVRAQYELLKENIISNCVQNRVTAYHGEFFQPIPPGIRADVIIADVSGIAEGPARALGWYPPEIPTGGEDGTEVIIKLLEEAGAYMKDNARLYFPVAIGLSDDKKIMQIAKSRFATLERKIEASFPLSPEQLIKIEPYLTIPYIHIERKGSRVTWKGEIYEAISLRTK